VTVSPGEIEFSDDGRPGLPAGDYCLVVEQQVELPPEFVSPEPYRNEQRMRVTGPHFGLGPQDVVSVYPPAQAEGDFSAALCHVILRGRGLPWEIPLEPGAGEPGDGGAGAEPGLPPWLAIVLLAPGEYVPAKADELTGAQPVPLANYLNPPPAVLGPDFLPERKNRWLAEFPDLSCPVVDVTSEAFAAVAPLAGELGYLAHVREVGASAGQPAGAAGELPDTQFAVVLSNRLPSGSPSGMYVAHLVSLEGFAGYLADRDGLPPGYSAVRLLSLARWAFTSTTGQPYIGDLLEGLDIGVPELDGSGAPEPIAKAISYGYVPADYRTRLGERTVAWYRGPCLPVQMMRNMQPIYETAEAALVYDSQTGMFDVSFAAGWQAGRLLALADRQFTTSFLAWIRDNHRLSQLLLERIELFRNYRLLGPGDMLTPRLPGRMIRRLIAEGVAAPLAGPPPLLGPPGDPSGLHGHLHRLPGLLSPAEVDRLLRAGQDPHTVLADRIRGNG